ERPFGLELEPLAERERLAQGGVQVDGSRAGYHAQARVPEPADRRDITGRVVTDRAGLPGGPPWRCRANESARVDPLTGAGIRHRPVGDTVGMLWPADDARTRARRIAIAEVGRFEGTALNQEDVAQAPSAQERVHNLVSIGHVGA